MFWLQRRTYQEEATAILPFFHLVLVQLSVKPTVMKRDLTNIQTASWGPDQTGCPDEVAWRHQSACSGQGVDRQRCKSNLSAIVERNSRRLWRHCTKWMWLVAEKKELRDKPACLGLSELSPLRWRNCANCIKRVWILSIMPRWGSHKPCWLRRSSTWYCFCWKQISPFTFSVCSVCLRRRTLFLRLPLRFARSHMSFRCHAI